MEQLPHELVERICGYLDIEDLKNTLTVSRSFQTASERASGVYAQYDLTRENAQQFVDLYQGRHRGYLRHVRFRAQLPPYIEDDDDNDVSGDEGIERTNHCRESLEELHEKDVFFTEEIQFALTTLSTIDDSTVPGKFQLTIETPIREVRDVACLHRKCVSWRLHLRNVDNLPELSSVRALFITDGSNNAMFPFDEDQTLVKVDLRVVVDLAVKMPNIEYLGCKMDGGRGWTIDYASEEERQYTKDWAGPHRDSRHDFSKALENSTLPSTLRQVQLDLLVPFPIAERADHTTSLPNLVSPATFDPFSSGLRQISSQLRKLELKVVADSTLFWPSDGSAEWPYLESLTVTFHISTPSGQWYFEGPNGDGHDVKAFEITEEAYPPLEDAANDAEMDEDFDMFDFSTHTSRRFRVRPNGDVMTPFLTSFAKAAQHMPALKEACLWVPLMWGASDIHSYRDFDATQIAKWPEHPLAWGITYVAPKTFGFHVFPGEHYSDSRQIWWTTADWRPNDHLHQLFRAIGNQQVELKEYWGQEEHWDKLAPRDMFEYFEIFGYRHPESTWPLEWPRE